MHILQSLTEGVSVSTEDGIIIFTNEAEDRMFGYERGELLAQLFATERWSGEWHNRRKDGTTFHTRVSISALRRGGVRHWVCVKRDVSAEKAAQLALRQSEERYRAFLAYSTEAIWRYEIDPPLDLNLSVDEQIDHVCRHGVLAELNDAMAHMCGYERAEELIGTSWAAMLPPNAEARAYLRSIAQAGYSVVDVESVERDRYGRQRHFSNSLVPVVEDGRLLRLWGTQRDITDRKLAETLLRENERRKDEFLAVLAHELRNPLAPIRNGLHILRQRAPLDEATQRTVSMMDRQMTHMVRLVDDLLDVGRITSGRLDLQREQVLLKDALAAAVEATRDIIALHEHALSVEVRDETLAVDADPNRLVQIFSNLLSNAAKYSNRGGRITVTLARDGNEAVLTCCDTGLGIPTAELENVFEMFSQVRMHQRHAAGGLGIGLALVRSLVEMHGGTVRAWSEGVGKGSTFTVRLPLLPPVRLQEGAPWSDAESNLELEASRILVVDDNVDAAMSLAMLLEINGAEVKVAFDGEQAVEVASEFAPQIIFMDLGMPKVDGLEATRRIRALPMGRAALVVAVTGWGQAADRERTQAAGFDHHLVKPISSAQIRALLCGVCNS